MKIIKGSKTKKKQKESSQAVGVGWYYPEQWNRLLEVAADRDALEDRYEDWLLSVQKAMFNIKSAGMSPKKVYVDIEKLIEWCKSINRPIDSAARAEFVSKLLIESL